MDLKGYVQDYLKEEVQAEALTRNLPAFSKFLRAAAITNGMLLNYSNAARESGVSVKTIREYYQILEDTLIGRQLAPWRKAKKRRLIETARFYFLIRELYPTYWSSARLHTGRTKMEGRLNISFFKNAGHTVITASSNFLLAIGERPVARKSI